MRNASWRLLSKLVSESFKLFREGGGSHDEGVVRLDDCGECALGGGVLGDTRLSEPKRAAVAVHRSVSLATAAQRAMTCGESVVKEAEGGVPVSDRGRGGGGDDWCEG